MVASTKFATRQVKLEETFLRLWQALPNLCFIFTIDYFFFLNVILLFILAIQRFSPAGNQSQMLHMLKSHDI